MVVVGGGVEGGRGGAVGDGGGASGEGCREKNSSPDWGDLI